MAADRDDFVFHAKLAEQAERYEEMCEFMRKVASLETEMSVEERNLLSVAYKNAVGARRASWRALTLAEPKYADAGNWATVDRLKNYRAKIESELEVYCGQLIDVIDAKVLPVSTSLESKVFFHKLKGDYARYLAEFAFGDRRKEVAEKALEAYRTATELAKDLFATHPVRIGLALNFSVFYYEILNSLHKACALAKAAFDEAIAGLDTLNEESYKDSTLIMQLLRDNLTLWSKELDQQSRAQTEVVADEQAN